MKILIVDDEAAIAQVFQQALQQAGFEVVLSATGKDGQGKAVSDKPDIILLDQILPDMNGNQVLKTLKSQDITKNIPVAIISNFNQKDLIEEGMKLGASEYILKYQISPQDLVEKVKNILAGQKGTGWQDMQDDVVV